MSLLADASKVDSNKVDRIKQQYSSLMAMEKEYLLSFDKDVDRLDNFYYKLLNGKQAYQEFFEVVKMLLCLSHGQATVERGFSMNKELVVENQSVQTLFSRRLIKDHLQDVGGIDAVAVTTELLNNCSNARHQYREYLDEQKKSKLIKEKSRKRKQVEEEIDDLKRQKISLNKSKKSLLDEAESLEVKGDCKGKLDLFQKAFALRKRAKEKEQMVFELDDKIAKKGKELGEKL